MQHMGHNEAILRGKFITVRAFIKKLERAHTTNLTAHLKALEQKEANPAWRWKKWTQGWDQ